MKKSCVNKVILSGGSTRIPKVQCMLQELIGRKELCKSLNPDEAVAYGAAVMAAKLSGNGDKSCQDLMLLDVTPLSLGVQVIGKVFDVVIPRNTPIPTKKSKIYNTTRDNQTCVDVKVYQGERTRSTDNHLLGKFRISEIPRAPKGVAELKRYFEIDTNGILTVTSEILSTGKTEKLLITNENGRLSKEQIQKMVKDAEKYKQEDQEYKKKADALNALEDCVYNMKKKIKNMAHGKSLRKMEKAITDITKWLEHKQTASIVEIQRMQKHLDCSRNVL
ncbi:unnamed protein product [Lactuca virosa]|uniref:Heat shock protein 70 n=1 Tax=Lactuca virosa TaxID=75947 RepID=A0AAU9P7A1_9ASTR|nr:unnamed protein product [Lactuca virosa]